MREYGVIYSKIWIDPDFQRFTNEEKLLFVYLLTCEHSNLIGCYRISLAYIADDLGWDKETTLDTMSTLCRHGVISIDTNYSWVFIHNYLKYNPLKNPSCATSAQKLFNAVPKECSFYPKLINVFKDLPKYLSKDFLDKINTLLTQCRHSVETVPSSVPVPGPVPVPGTNTPVSTSYSAIHSLAARDFFALFAADGYFLNKVNGNPQTVSMIYEWLVAGVTVEEAKAVIEQTNAKRGKKATSPSYYRDIVLDAKRAGIAIVDKNFQEEIKKTFHEILPDNPINIWTKKAATDLQERINGKYEKMDMTKINSWRNFFLLVKSSGHIKKHEWHLDYLIREDVFANILNGKRHSVDELENYQKLKQGHTASLPPKEDHPLGLPGVNHDKASSKLLDAKELKLNGKSGFKDALIAVSLKSTVLSHEQEIQLC